jgi:hypothetical protein
MTIVLKLPLTSAASTNGLERYNGFGADGVWGDRGIVLGGGISVGENVAEVGVVGVVLFGGRWAPRVIDRLMLLKKDMAQY